MHGKIPTQVGEKKFDSQNQAKEHYLKIARSYQTGETLKVEDKKEVVELMKASAPERHQNAQVKNIKTYKGKFGKKCLQASMDGVHYSPLSIVASVRHCATPALIHHGLV